MKYIIALSITSLFLVGCTTQGDQITQQTQAGLEEKTSIKQTVEQSEETTESHESISLATYQEFSEDKYNQLKGNQPFALYFHADWCPICNALDKNIQANLSDLPENTVILKANFDSETALKREYGVTMQTTFIFFDQSGEIIETVNDPSIERIAANFN